MENRKNKMEILATALDMGAEIQIGFYNAKSEKEAKAQIQPFVELMGQPYRKTKGDAFDWFRVNEGTIEVTAAYLKMEGTE